MTLRVTDGLSGRYNSLTTFPSYVLKSGSMALTKTAFRV